MKTFKFEYLNNYANHGQNAEQSVRFTLTGEVVKADNLRYDLGTDCLNYQIKSARATVCKGTDLKAYLDLDASSEYIYADNDGTAWIMNREEYESFCTEFGSVQADSRKNGGDLKIRLKSESKAMKEWLKARA
jgi:hypothetical protein